MDIKVVGINGRAAACILALLLTASAPLLAQTQAEIGGTITDPTGAVIPGVSATVTNVETGAAQNTTSNQVGFWVIPLLPPGDYRLELSADGFKPYRRTGITLYTGDQIRLDLTMELGSVTEEVTVAGAAPLLETATATRGQVIDNQKIVDLPLNGRDYLQLALISSGVGQSLGGRMDTFVASGQRANQNNFLLDGVDNNIMQRAAQGRQAEVVKPSIDAIQEFKIMSNTYSAEYGRAGGGVVAVSLKSGANEVHGSVFEFLRNENFDAKNFFDDPDSPKPAFKRNQFGFAVGGPIINDKLFYFGDYEGTRIRESRTVLSTIPTRAQIGGDFSELLPDTIFDPATYNPDTGQRQPFPNNRIPESRFDSVGAKALSLYPEPNRPGLTRNFLFAPPDPEDLDRGDARIDYHITDRDRVFGRYSHSFQAVKSSPNLPGPAWGGGNPAASFDHEGQNFVLSYSRTFSPTFIMEAKAAWNRRFTLRSAPIENNFNQELGLKGVDLSAAGMADFRMSGFRTVGLGPWLPNLSGSQNRQVIANFTSIKGNHTTKFGLNFQFLQHFLTNSQNSLGRFQFDSTFTRNTQTLSQGSPVADMLLGMPFNSSVSTWVWEDMRRPYYDFFVQDEWRVTPRLTLNLGLRYELHLPWIDRLNNGSNLDFTERFNPQIVIFQDGSRFSRSLVHTDKNNFGPRVGIAFKATDKTVIRTGYGIYYGNTVWKPISSTNPPHKVGVSLVTDRINPNVVLQEGFPPGVVTVENARRVGLAGTESNNPLPYVQQWNFTIQRQLPSDVLFDVGYVGAVSHKLTRITNMNLPLELGPGSLNSRRPIQTINVPPTGTEVTVSGATLYTRQANSNYHALQLRLEKRLSQGMSWLSSYIWSKTISDAPGGGGVNQASPNMAQNAFNISAERSLADEHFPHRFVTSVIYDLPFGRGRPFLTNASPVVDAILGGWTTSGILTLQSGRRINLSVQGNPANSGTPNRPDVVAGVDPELSGSQQSLDRFFNTDAFVRNTRFAFGNAGRNLLGGPSLANLDFAVYKTFRINERIRTQFRVEAFNVTNTPNFGIPNAQVGNRNFGQINSAGRPRNLQLGLKIIF